MQQLLVYYDKTNTANQQVTIRLDKYSMCETFAFVKTQYLVEFVLSLFSSSCLYMNH